jgi:hypothetical protein
MGRRNKSGDDKFVDLGYASDTMSRSRRKTPKLAITCAESEKDDTRIAARRERARVTSRLSAHAASEPDFDLIEHGEHPSHGHWVFAKDGKYYAGPNLSADDIKQMRK